MTVWTSNCLVNHIPRLCGLQNGCISGLFVNGLLTRFAHSLLAVSPIFALSVSTNGASGVVRNFAPVLAAAGDWRSLAAGARMSPAWRILVLNRPTLSRADWVRMAQFRGCGFPGQCGTEWLSLVVVYGRGPVGRRVGWRFRNGVRSGWPMASRCGASARIPHALMPRGEVNQGPRECRRALPPIPSNSREMHGCPRPGSAARTTAATGHLGNWMWNSRRITPRRPGQNSPGGRAGLLRDLPGIGQ